MEYNKVLNTPYLSNSFQIKYLLLLRVFHHTSSIKLVIILAFDISFISTLASLVRYFHALQIATNY